MTDEERAEFERLRELYTDDRRSLLDLSAYSVYHLRRLEAENAALREIVRAVAEADIYQDSQGSMLIVAYPSKLVAKARTLLEPTP